MKKHQKAFLLLALPFFLTGCGEDEMPEITLEESLLQASLIYASASLYDGDEFSASQKKIVSQDDGSKNTKSIDVRLRKGKYAYYSSRDVTETSDGSETGRPRDDYYLFSQITPKLGEGTEVVGFEENFIFAEWTPDHRKQYNVITKERFDSLMEKMEKEIRLAFQSLQEEAYSYLSGYDGIISPNNYALADLDYHAYAEGDAFLIKTGKTHNYTSHLVSVYFGETIEKDVDMTDVYSEEHRFEEGRPIQVADSFVRNKVQIYGNAMAFGYGSCNFADWTSTGWTDKTGEVELDFDPAAPYLSSEGA